MSIGTGLAASLGVAAETTFGTYVAPTRFYEFNSESLAKVKNFVQGGGLGKIKEVFVGIGTTSKPCDLPEETPKGEIEWDRWLGQTPQRPYNSRLAHAGELDGSTHRHEPEDDG